MPCWMAACEIKRAIEGGSDVKENAGSCPDRGGRADGRRRIADGVHRDPKPGIWMEENQHGRRRHPPCPGWRGHSHAGSPLQLAGGVGSNLTHPFSFQLTIPPPICGYAWIHIRLDRLRAPACPRAFILRMNRDPSGKTRVISLPDP